MATIAKLKVLVTATTAPFKKALRSAGITAKKFGAAMSTIGKQIKRFGLIAITAGAAGLALMTKRAFTAIDSMGKLSNNIGVSTEKLAGFHLAARIGGVKVEAMDKALQKMTRNIGNAGIGLATQVKSLKKLGTSFDELKLLTVSEQFAILSTGLRNLDTDVERAANAADIFGRAGIDLISVLATGAEGMAKMQAEAVRLGLALNRATVKEVEDANDAITMMKSSVQGIARSLAVALSPAVISASKFIEGLAVSLRRVTKAQVSAAFSTAALVAKLAAAALIIPKIVRAVITTVVVLKSLAKAQILVQAFAGPKGWAALAAGAAVFAGSVLAVDRAMGNVVDSIKDASSEGQKFAKVWTTDIAPIIGAGPKTAKASTKKQDAGALKEAQDIIKKMAGTLQGATPIEKFLDRIGRLDVPDKLKNLAQDLADSIAQKGIREELEGQAKALKALTQTPLEEFGKKAKEIKDLFAGGFINAETMKRGLKDAKDELDAAAPQRESLRIGFRSDAFVAALRAGGGAVSVNMATPETRKLDTTNKVLDMILRAIREQNLGLA